jgi:hypothetical protein
VIPVLLHKFTSRKFLLTLAAFITLIAEGAYTEAAAVVAAYGVAEAAVDVRALRTNVDAFLGEVDVKKSEIEADALRQM